LARNIRVIPAILTDNTATLEKLVRQTKSFTNYAQLDMMDGHFVPSHSFLPEDLAKIKIDIEWEAHLMMLQPEDHLQTLKKAGARKIIFHVEAVASLSKEISLIKALGMKVGLAINPETPISMFKDFVSEADSILFMAVHPGFYGAKFLPEVLGKIKEFRKTWFKTVIGLDGGVKENNIADIARSGVNEICVGSAIFLQPDPGTAHHKLTELAQAALA
jgi:ribulose-phosphate 3-epimerase